MEPKQLIDFAQDGNGIEFRNALYSSIHDKVTAHIDAKKQEIAQALITPEEQQSEPSDETV
jgi:hypothetical protein